MHLETGRADTAGHELEVVAGQLARLVADFRLGVLRSQLSVVWGSLSEPALLDVAVVGRFKAGKSSFLNHLIGRPVLPEDVLPATAVVTQVAYGPEDQGVVRSIDGTVQQVDLARVPEFVTEHLNPGNTKAVASVEVDLPSLAAYRGLRFVDTPGLDSVFTHNTRTAMDWLPHVGVALVAMSVDPPLAQNDLRLLADVAAFTPEVVILLTKVDLVPRPELARVLAFVDAQVDERLGRRLPILPFSVKPGYEAEREATHAHLEDLIMSREDTSRAIVVHKLGHLVGEAEQYLRVGLAAARANDEARRELVQLLETERAHQQHVNRELRVLAEDLRVRAREASTNEFRSMRHEVERGLAAGFVQESKKWRGHLGKTTGGFRAWLEGELVQQLQQASRAGEHTVRKNVGEASSSFERVVRAFQDRVSDEVEHTLKVKLPEMGFVPEVDEPSHPDIRMDKPFDTAIELIWFAIPMRVFRPLVLRHFRRQLAWEAEKNLTRLAGQWSEAVGVCIEEMARQAQAFIAEELTTVERLLAQPQEGHTDIEGALRELEAIGRRLPARSPVGSQLDRATGAS
ncbi:MAG: dynamin family protein [Thermoleophilia bacterium]|nr:dynamin family protein [Thermoleophilia bacterium]